MMRWLAIHFGKKIEWNGPTVFGVGYAWCGKIWFEDSPAEKKLKERLKILNRSDFWQGALDRWDTVKDIFRFWLGQRKDK